MRQIARTIAPLCCVAALVACASDPEPPAPAPQPAAIIAAKPTGLVLRPGVLDPEAAKAALGPAAVERADGAGLYLMWRTPECALALVFSAAADGALRLADATAMSPRLGAPTPSAEACVSALEAKRR